LPWDHIVESWPVAYPPFEIFAVLTFKIVQLREDSLTTNGREWTRIKQV
jgi:hypothetical protein